MATKYPLSKYNQRVVDATLKYAPIPGFVFLAKRHHLQVSTGPSFYPEGHLAALRVYDRISKSRGTIVSISVKEPQQK